MNSENMFDSEIFDNRNGTVMNLTHNVASISHSTDISDNYMKKKNKKMSPHQA